MNPITYTVNNANILQFADDLDAGTINPVKELFNDYANSDKDVVIDLTDVHFIDSSGIGAIVFLYKRLLAKKLAVHVIGLHGQPEQLFDMLQLNRNLKCYSTLNDFMGAVERHAVVIS